MQRFLITVLGALVLLTFPTVGQGQAPSRSSAEPSVNVGTAQPPANYQLAGGDTVLVRVFREPDLDSQQRLSRDGTINLPLLGIVRLAGKTTNEAAATIVGLLAPDYILHPQVSVSISAYNKQQFTVLGQVNTPGTYVLPEEQQSIDILAAVARAGGFTRLAKLSEVIVRRTTGSREETFNVDVSRMLRDKSTPRFVVQPNDTISVAERFF